jgi:hypothetical protein
LAAQGLQGLHGLHGLQGLRAAHGLQGLQGLCAAQGLAAAQGLQGLQGLAAAQGLHGLQGLQGLAGAAASAFSSPQGVCSQPDRAKAPPMTRLVAASVRMAVLERSRRFCSLIFVPPMGSVKLEMHGHYTTH